MLPTTINRLRAAIEWRLGQVADIQPAYERPHPVVTLPTKTMVLDPKTQRLTSYHSHDFDTIRIYPELSPCEWNASVDMASRTLVHTTLQRRQYVFTADIDVNEPVPLQYDHSGRWKAHPPSKRRHMLSWRRATAAEKLRYKPLANSRAPAWAREPRRLPNWAKHPDHYRVHAIGTVTLVQSLYIYALDELTDEQQQRCELEWHLANVVPLFDCSRR